VCNQLAWAETETAIRYMEKKDIKKWGFGIKLRRSMVRRSLHAGAVHNGNGRERRG
jgi:hypothetical protein